MKLIYVAGKYSGKTFSEIDDNIRKAEAVTLELLKLGWAVITPHLNSAHFERYESYLKFGLDNWLARDFEIIKRCDAVFFMKDWQLSKGANKEFDFAKTQNHLYLYFEEHYANYNFFPKP